jgi:hypothetical protein
LSKAARRTVCIFHTGDDPDDGLFARRIAERIRPFCAPQLIDVDELERMDRADSPRIERFPGVPVCVVSPAMLRLSYYRKKLATAAPRRNLPGRAAFYICRGITTAEMRHQYPDLERLFLDVMVGETEDLAVLTDELKDYLEQTPDRVTVLQRVRQIAGFLAAYGMHLVGSFGYLAYFAAFPAACWLIGSLLLTDTGTALKVAAACHLLYGAGYGVNRLRPLDLWPWLGPAWSLGQRFAGNHGDSGGAPDLDSQAIRSWQQMVGRARITEFVVLSWLGIPGMAAFWKSSRAWMGGAAFLLGLTVPRLWSTALRYLVRRAYWESGLSDEELDRTARFFSPWGSGITTESDYRFGGTHGGRMLVHRPWFSRRPHVFISYAWRDEEQTPAARILQQTVARINVPCFLDTRKIPGKFSSWRARVADEILDCTHFFLVLGPNVNEAQVVHREIKTALQRWNTELEPAVLCVVEPEVSDGLERSKLSPELKYLLHQAPKLTYAEAAQQEVLEILLFQRCRQGLCRDWVTLLRPAARLRGFLKCRSIPEAERLQ